MNEQDTIKLVSKLEKLIKLNQLEEIQKLDGIKSLDYENYADIFIEACANDCSQIVKYLYELKTPSNFALAEGFRCCLDKDNFNTVKTLLEDLHINKSSEVKSELKAHLNELKSWNKDFYNKVSPLFSETKKVLLKK